MIKKLYNSFRKNSEQPFNYRINNFNLIRLFAAFQVIITHLHHLFAMPEWTKYISLFNGVPIFFTLSGFLIYWSYDNNPHVRTYFTNRFLRIFPALFCAFITTIILLITLGILTAKELSSSSFILWIFTQLTFIQEFTPSIVHGFGGSNNPNSALWTISVEMLLYIAIPFIYFCINKLSKKNKIITIIILGIISYTQNQTAFISHLINSISDNNYYLILMHPFNQFCSFFFFFCIGIIIYLSKENIIPIIAHKGTYFLIAYIVFSSFCYYQGYEPGIYDPHFLELVSHVLLVLCIFSIAYSKPNFTEKMIGKTDISYGLYIYHFLVINSFYTIGLKGNWLYIFPLLVTCFMIAWLSWNLVEKRALKLKKKSLYK